MRSKKYLELLDIICYSRTNGNILSTGQCITIHQYNNGIVDKISIDLQKKINFITNQINANKWQRPELSYDTEKTLQIRNHGDLNYKPFKTILK